jgi:nucleoside-diphosphate-sugar epimerase
MRVFVTGASGFIGSHLIPLLLQSGLDVAILARQGSSMQRLRDHIEKLTVIRGDLSDLDRLSDALSDFQPEACVHLAWYAEPGSYLHSRENLNHLFNSLRLLELMIEMGCKQAVMVGTCAEYDTDTGYLKETSPVKPSTVYAASKLSLAILGGQIARDADIKFVWARLFYLYGRTEDSRRMVPAVVNSLLRDVPFRATRGEQIRDYLHVEDAASALRFILRRGLSGVFNISSGTPVTVRNVMEWIGEMIGKPHLIQFGALPYREWEPMFVCGDNQKLRRLGWQPNIPLREGLRDTIEWWKNSQFPK